MTEHVGGQWMKIGLRFGCNWGFEEYIFHVEVSLSCTGEHISAWNIKSEWLSGSFAYDEGKKLLTSDYNQSIQRLEWALRVKPAGLQVKIFFY